jgi:hypothetical protein
MRAGVRPRRPVPQTYLALGVEPGNPAVRALPRNALSLRGMRDRPPLDTHPLDQQQPAAEGQTGITVRHEDLRMVDDLDIAHRTRRSSLRQQPGPSVTNVPAEYT